MSEKVKGNDYPELKGMSNYIGTKISGAKPMTRLEYNKFRGWDLPGDEIGSDAGYIVQYTDGYISWSPEAQFQNAYRKTEGMNFGLAIEAMKKGLKVQRKGWNGNLPPKIPQKPIYTPKDRCEIFDEYTFFLSSKGSVAVIDTDALHLLAGAKKFTEGSGGYFTNTNNATKTNTKLHQMIMPAPEGLMVDHINGDILDNRKVNLRLVTAQQNTMNRKPKGKFKGVCFDRSRDKFNAAIQLSGKSINLGRYATELEAAKAYDERALKEFGEYAYLNFPAKNLPMFLFLVNGSTFKVNRPPLLGIYPEGTEISYHAHIDMKTADGQVVPWLASQTDMLADDWQVFRA